MYVSPNFKTKKALKEAIERGDPIQVYQPNNIFNVSVPRDGNVYNVYLEGPHYPEAHKWYAKGVIREGKLVKVS